MISASWRCFQYDRKCLFSCIYNPQITISPTSLFSVNFNGNRVKNHPQPWTCPLRDSIAVNPFWEWTLVQSLWTCISLMQARVFFLVFFSLVAAAFWIPMNTCGSGRKKQCCAKYTCATSNLTSDEISYPPALGQSVCIWRWCVSAARSTIFSIFSLSFKTKKIMKIMFSCTIFQYGHILPK